MIRTQLALRNRTYSTSVAATVPANHNYTADISFSYVMREWIQGACIWGTCARSDYVYWRI